MKKECGMVAWNNQTGKRIVCDVAVCSSILLIWNSNFAFALWWALTVFLGQHKTQIKRHRGIINHFEISQRNGPISWTYFSVASVLATLKHCNFAIQNAFSQICIVNLKSHGIPCELKLLHALAHVQCMMYDSFSTHNFIISSYRELQISFVLNCSFYSVLCSSYSFFCSLFYTTFSFCCTCNLDFFVKSFSSFCLGYRYAVEHILKENFEEKKIRVHFKSIKFSHFFELKYVEFTTFIDFLTYFEKKNLENFEYFSKKW